jgi:hypothetical protein
MARNITQLPGLLRQSTRHLWQTLSAEIGYVNIGAEARVVGEIPAVVIGVCINHDVVAVPIPVVGIGQVEWGDAEVEAAKPEAAGIAAFQAPAVRAAEAAVEAAMLPGMIEVKTYVVAAVVVSNPFAVVVDVGGFGMALTVVEMPVGIVMIVVVTFAVVRVAMIGLGTMVGDVSAADIVVAVAVIAVVFVLRQGWHGKD